MKAAEVCLFVNNQIWWVTLKPLCVYVGGVEGGGGGGRRKFGDTAHALIWEWRGAGLSRGGRDADGEGRGGERRESFYMERSLRGE